jgi:hypothetical protein
MSTSRRSPWSPAGAPHAAEPGSLVDLATERVELPGSGVSGAKLEALVFADDSRLVLKEISPEWDWMMVATHDTGRAAELWVSGAMDHLPATVDPAIVRIEQTDSGWRIYMRDVDEHFLRRGTVVSRSEARRFLDSFADLHAAYWNRPPNGLCSIEDLLGLVSPATINAHMPPEHPFRAHILRGWEVFADIAPADMADSVSSILADPSGLADRLRQSGTTLVHGDPHYGNVAPLEDRLVVLDWSLAAAAPPAIDFVWFLKQSARFIDATREQLADEFRAAEGEHHDERTLDLAYLMQFVLSASEFQGVVEGASEDRAAAHEEFEWWIAAVRRGLEAW